MATWIFEPGHTEAEFRARLAPHLTATHGRKGGAHLTQAELDAMAVAYMTPETADSHLEHLHQHFRVQRKTP